LAGLLKKSLWVCFYAKAKSLAQEQKQITDGLDVRQFEDAQAALAYLENTAEHVDMIFAEATAVRFDGCHFIRRCYECFSGKYATLIVVADKGRQQDIEKGLAAGAHDYLLKPFAPEDLLKHIFNAWQRPEDGSGRQKKES